MKHVSTLAVGALSFYSELNTLQWQNLKSYGMIKISKKLKLYVDMKTIHVSANRANACLSNQTFFKKFGPL